MMAARMSRPPTARAWSGCCVTARERRLPVRGCAKRASSWSTAAPSSTASPAATYTASGPPLSDGCDTQMGDGVYGESAWDEAAQPAPDDEVDQRVSRSTRQLVRGGKCAFAAAAGQGCACHCQKMCKPKNLGRLALNKRSGSPSLKACDAQNLGHNRPHVVGFPIRIRRPDLGCCDRAGSECWRLGAQRTHGSARPDVHCELPGPAGRNVLHGRAAALSSGWGR